MKLYAKHTFSKLMYSTIIVYTIKLDHRHGISDPLPRYDIILNSDLNLVDVDCAGLGLSSYDYFHEVLKTCHYVKAIHRDSNKKYASLLVIPGIKTWRNWQSIFLYF